MAICICVLSVFAVIFVIPFVEEWPYEIHFTLENIRNVLRDKELSNVYLNSLYVAFYTAAFWNAACIWKRSGYSKKQGEQKVLKQIIDGIAMVTNTIPGMVLGLAFLFCFFRYRYSEYIFDHGDLQYDSFLFNAVSDDERISCKDECLLGNYSHAHGRQLDQNDPESCYTQRHFNHNPGVQLLLY